MNWICMKCGEPNSYFTIGSNCQRCGWKRPKKLSKTKEKERQL